MNIQKILTQLHEKMSDAKIGEAIDAPQSIVTRLRRGTHKRTFYDRAIAIKQLAEQNGIDV